MISSYKLDKSFGPTGSITGIILFAAGVIFSAYNRQLDIPSEDYRLILFNASGEKIVPIKKVVGLSTAKENIEMIFRQLEINKL